MAAFDEPAARRGSKVRCPACVRSSRPRGPVPRCVAAEEIPAERHGSARMLLEPRGWIASRWRAGGRPGAEPGGVFERQYTEQWALSQLLLEDVRFCQGFLLQQGFVEDAEEALAQRAPDGSARGSPGSRLRGAPRTLEALLTKSDSWFVQRLSALALLHQGNTSPNVLYPVHLMLCEKGRMGVESMLALTRWRVWRWVPALRGGWNRVRELARKALAQPELAARAAVGWCALLGDETPDVDVLFALRQGLSHSDPDVRFECALCLKDEAGLLAALDSPHAELVAEARRDAGPLGSSALFSAAGSPGGLGLCRGCGLHAPQAGASEALDAVLSASERGPDRLTEALCGSSRGSPSPKVRGRARDAGRTWARSMLQELPGEAVLRFLHWAGHPPVAPEHAVLRGGHGRGAHAGAIGGCARRAGGRVLLPLPRAGGP